MKSFRKVVPALTLGSVVLLAACTEQSPTELTVSPQFNEIGEPAFVLLKKFGPTPPYTFQLSATIPSLPLGNVVAVGVTDWVKVWEATTPGSGTFTATEVLQPGVQVDSIWILTLVRGADGFLHEGTQTKLTGTNMVNLNVSYDLGAYVRVFNSEAEAEEGCTPGFWKQTHHFDSWPQAYTPTTPFGSVFANAFPGMTLLDVLSSGGGDLTALGRHTVAALLNATSPEVGSSLTGKQVIQAFNSAFASGNFEATKDMFEKLNEQNCPF